MFEQQEEIQEKRLQHRIEMQSMQIENVFNRHQVEAQVAGGMVKPRSISFDLQTQLATGLERLKILTDDLMHTLGVPVSLSREGGRFHVHVSHPDAPPVSLLDLLSMLTDVPPITAVMGLAEDGRPVLLDFSEQDMTHILVAGVSEAGKTALLRSLAISLALMNRQSRVQFVILDGASQADSKGGALQVLNYLPHMLTNVMANRGDIQETLTFLMSEVSYRLEHEVAAPTILVMIDEVVTLLEMGEATIRDAIRFLAQRGADVGVHLVMSTDEPQAAVLDNLLKANISVQIVGRMADSAQAMSATGSQSTQAEQLLGRGDFLAVAGEYITHFQAAYIGDYDLHLTLQELHRNRPPALLAQTVAECQPISLLKSEEAVFRLVEPQLFVFDGEAVSMPAEDEDNESVTVVEESVDEVEVEAKATELYVVPQPVIRLFHDAEVDEEEAFIAESGDGETAVSSVPIVDERQPPKPAQDRIYQALSKAKYAPDYRFQSQVTLVREKTIELAPFSVSERATVGGKERELEDSDLENEVQVAKRGDHAQVDAESDDDLETEYEVFEDDWLPFDDE